MADNRLNGDWDVRNPLLISWNYRFKTHSRIDRANAALYTSCRLAGMVAPLVLWPTDAINGVTMVHLSAAFAALLAAYITHKVIWGMLAGLVVFFSPVIITLL